VEPAGVKFGVVIPTRDRASVLRRCLAAINSQGYPDYEVIVVDDGSRDDTGEIVVREFPSIGYLRQPSAGPAAARNRGVKAAGGEVVAFTDDDCLAPSNWLECLADGFARHPEVAGVGGRLLAPLEVRETNLLAQYEEYVVKAVYGAGDCEIVSGFDCPAGGTNNMAYRRAALETVGGFDEDFRYPAGEDADLKWRLAEAGARFLYIPVEMTHLQSYTWPSYRRQQMVRGRGRTQFDIKRSRRTGRALIVLRLMRSLLRVITWPPPRANLLRPAVEEAWFSALGQWAALREM
jgi:glycosyltransferase involved in cell wall biosynthesis